MRSGARIYNKTFIITKHVECKKCAVCGKALRTQNKSGLCYLDLHIEYTINYRHQLLNKLKESRVV